MLLFILSCSQMFLYILQASADIQQVMPLVHNSLRVSPCASQQQQTAETVNSHHQARPGIPFVCMSSAYLHISTSKFSLQLLHTRHAGTQQMRAFILQAEAAMESRLGCYACLGPYGCVCVTEAS